MTILTLTLILLAAFFYGVFWILKKISRWKETIQKQSLYFKTQVLEREDLVKLVNDHIEELLAQETQLKEEVRKNLRAIDIVGQKLFYPELLRETLEGAVQPLEEIRLAKTLIAKQGRHERQLRKIAEEAALLKAKQEGLIAIEQLKLPRRQRLIESDEQPSRELESRD